MTWSKSPRMIIASVLYATILSVLTWRLLYFSVDFGSNGTVFSHGLSGALLVLCVGANTLESSMSPDDLWIMFDCTGS